jgi:hypothetical protein
MSAPPGWHLQPDGRERWWDGEQWSDQFRDPLPSDPTAPADLGASAAGSTDPTGTPPWAGDQTQALDVDRTQAIPAPPPGGYGGEPGAPPTHQTGYGGPGYGGPGQGAPGYGAPGYGAPGAPGPYPPPRQGMSGAAKGCLFAALGILVIIVIAVAAAFFFFARTADRISKDIATTFPTTLPSDFPSEVPSDFPSLGGAPVETTVGGGFDLPRATVAPGWSVEGGSFGSRVTGMTATLTGSERVPVVFSMSFERAGGDAVETACTATPESESAPTATVSCLPLFGDVSGVTRVVVTPAF